MSAYAVNPRKVVHQTIDGEAILIQFETGAYYSLAGAGAEIWHLLAGGRSIDEIVTRLGQAYDAGADELRHAVEGLVEELTQEDLIEPGPEASLSPSTKDGNTPAGERSAFQPPMLEKFTDMQDFLLVDPIHEVDESGWPSVKAEG